MRDESVYSENYKGFNIKIYQDADSQNPFEDWDCEPPLAVYSDRSITEYATQYGNVNSVPNLTRKQIIKNLKEIIVMLEVKNVWELTEDRREWYRDDIVGCINENIVNYIDCLNNSDRLEALCGLYNMAGIPAVVKSVHGSTQSCYAEVLAVATKEFQRACGNEAGFWNNPDNLKNSIQLFEDWVYGNVYGYVIEDEDGESLDSCWGFFGNYNSEYSALSEAKSAVDYRVEENRKDQIQQVKAWIRNHVPLGYRHFA